MEILKEKARQDKNYGGIPEEKKAGMATTACPHCGAARAKQDGLTHCAYCGHEFLAIKLTDGLHLKKEDNSTS